MTSISVSNHRVFERRSTVLCWTSDLTVPERTILAEHAADIDGKEVLDLGVGTGRTTPFLAPRAKRYVGLDYSARAVALCRERFPSLDIQHGDARDLRRFPQHSFDFVLFSFNGIDAVDHEGRMKVLQEVFRVLRPGGLLAFSSHNLSAVGSSFMPQLLMSRTATNLNRLLNPLHVLVAVQRFARRLYNHARNARRERRGPDRAILNDGALEFALVLYYVTKQEQSRQLKEIGFPDSIETYPEDGDPPYSLYYVTRKPRTVPPQQ